MKKLIALLMVLMILVALVACGNESAKSPIWPMLKHNLGTNISRKNRNLSKNLLKKSLLCDIINGVLRR